MAWIIDGHDPRLPAFWPAGATDYDPTDAGLVALLAAARADCEAFAPPLGDGEEMPATWPMAQALRARDLARAGLGTSDQAGLPGEEVAVYPLDWQIKQLLRPKTPPVIA